MGRLRDNVILMNAKLNENFALLLTYLADAINEFVFLASSLTAYFSLKISSSSLTATSIGWQYECSLLI